MPRATSEICRKSRSANPYDHTAARVASSQRSRLSPRKKRSRRRPRGVVDISVLLAGVAGFRNVEHNASANFLKRWVNTFAWLISEEILARHKVRRQTSPEVE